MLFIFLVGGFFIIYVGSFFSFDFVLYILGDNYLDIVRVYYGLGCVFGVFGLIEEVLENIKKVCEI